jgi:hypothetical protein
MNKSSWVRDLVHVSFSSKPIFASVNIPGSERDPYEDDLFSNLFHDEELRSELENTLKQSGTSLREICGGEAAADAFFDRLMEVIWEDTIDTFCQAPYQVFANTYKCDRKLSIALLPCLVKSKRFIKEDRVNHDLVLFAFLDIPGYNFIDSDGSKKSYSAHSLGGFYEHGMSLVCLDISGMTNGCTAMFHETMHMLIRHLNDQCNLGDYMYGSDELCKLEEVMVHLVTDCHIMLDAIHKFCTSITYSRDNDGNMTNMTLPEIEFQFNDGDESGLHDAYTVKSNKCAKITHVKTVRHIPYSLTKAKSNARLNSLRQIKLSRTGKKTISRNDVFKALLPSRCAKLDINPTYKNFKAYAIPHNDGK